VERFIFKELIAWKESKYRKPLILKGVRQVGKTWILKEFGKQYYDNIAYFNFDESEEYKQFFETTKDVHRIIQNLIMASGQIINPHKTLLIFDEIQECKNALNTLKYFSENAPEYHVACAGSLLGIAINKQSSFPVGKVNFINIMPMSFSEFLTANGDENFVNYMNEIDKLEPLDNAFFNPLAEKMKMYFITGGMPEVVLSWVQERNVDMIQQTLADILNAYELDFGKYAEKKDIPRLSMIWKSIPSQLARENKKFIYKAIKEGARAREYEDALIWLCDAALVSKIYRITSPGLPLSAYDDISSFKLYLVDVGLLRRHALLSPTAFAEGNRLFTEFKGALSENYILQSLMTQFETIPRYWAVDHPRYEVDYIVQYNNDIIPIEVKSDSSIDSISLRKYKEKYGENVKLRVRFSMLNLKLDDDFLNIPIFLADQTERFIKMALDS